MDFIDLMAIHIVPINDWTFNLNVVDFAALFTEEVVMGRGHAIVAEFSARDRDRGSEVFRNKGVQGIVDGGHRHCRDFLDERFVYRLDRGMRINVRFQVLEDFESLVGRLQSVGREGIF